MKPRFRFSRLVRRRIPRPVFYVLAAILVPLLGGVAGAGAKVVSLSGTPEAPPYAGELPPPPSHDPSRKVAVVLSSARGAEITDFLPPYEILARSGAFDVFVVAPERRVMPLVNANMTPSGLDFVPHHSFQEYETAVGRAPDVIVIPWFPGYTATRDAALVDWIRTHAGPQTTVLTICAGTEILADTGLLDGRTATTNVGWFGKLRERVPTATWIEGVRYADDGAFITSTNVASGIDASLHAVDRLVGRAAAEEVARQLGYPHTRYLDDPSSRPSMDFALPLVASVAYQWGWEELGVMLYDGVSELALASLIDPYTASFSARMHTLAPERKPIRSRHGLTLIPRSDFQTAPRLDRVVLPGDNVTDAVRGAASALAQARRGLPVQEVHRGVGNGESAFDATLKDMARVRGSALALGVGQALFYPVQHLSFEEVGRPTPPLALPAVLGLLGIGLAYALGRRAPARRVAEAA